MEALFPFTSVPTRPADLQIGEWGQKDTSESMLQKQLKDLPFVTEDILFFSPGDRIHVLERQAGCSWWLGAIRMSKTASTESELRILKLQAAAAATSACANSTAMKTADESKSKSGLTSRLAKHASQKWIDEATELATAKLDTMKSSDSSPLLLPAQILEEQLAAAAGSASPASPVRMLQSNQLPGNFNIDRPYSLVDDGKLFLISTYGGGEEIYKIGYFYAPYCRAVVSQKKHAPVSPGTTIEEQESKVFKDPTQLVDAQVEEERLKQMLGLDSVDDAEKNTPGKSAFRDILSGKEQEGSEGKAQLKRLQDALFSEKSSFARAMQNQTATSFSVETIRDELLKLTVQLRRSAHKSNRDLALLQAEESVLVRRFLRSISQLDLHKDSELRSLVTTLAAQWPKSTLEDVEEQLKNLGLQSLLKEKSGDEESETVEDETFEDQIKQIHSQSNAMKLELRRLGVQLEHVTARNEVLECFADEAPEAAPAYNCTDFFSKEDAASPQTTAPSKEEDNNSNTLDIEAPSMEDLADDPSAKRLLKKMGKRFMECETTKEDYLSQKEKIEKGLVKAAEAVKHIEEAMSQRKRRVEKQMEIIEISKSLGSTPQWEDGTLIGSSVHPSILKQYKGLLISQEDVETNPFIDECEAALLKIETKSKAMHEKLKVSRAAHEQIFMEQHALTSTAEERRKANDELERTVAFVKKECLSLAAAAEHAKEDVANIGEEKKRAEDTCSKAIRHWAEMKSLAAVELEHMDTRIKTETGRIGILTEQLNQLLSPSSKH